MRLKTLLTTIVLAIPFYGFCQYDSIVNQMKREFDAFKKGIEQEHQQFKSRNDSIFSAFLKESWESFHLLYKPKPAEKPKPVVQPALRQGEDLKNLPTETIPADSSSVGRHIIPGKQQNESLPSENFPGSEKVSETSITFNYFGTPLSVSTSLAPPDLSNLDSKGISAYFDLISGSASLMQFTKKLLLLKKERKLNDWGYLQLVRSSARKITHSENEAELISWVTLLKSGINAKVGYTTDQVLLMVPSFEDIYVSWYIKINEKPYYILNDGTTKEKVSSLIVHKADYPGNLPVSLELNELPILDKSLVSREFSFRDNKFTISVNRNLMDFFKSYPQSNMRVFFATPLSLQISQSLDTFLVPKMKNLTERQKVALLLEFTQKAFAYKTDRDQFNREKFYFPDELFFYPFSDCEDRSILFTRLVKHFTGLNCIGLDYPKHVNTAVAMGENASGDFIRYKKTKYLICDPTYINAPVGYLPKEYNDIKPEVINFEQNHQDEDL